MRRWTSLVSAVVIVTATLSGQQAVAGERHSTVVQPPLVDSYKDWLLQSFNGTRNGLRREIAHVYGDALGNGTLCTAVAPCQMGGLQQSTAACKSLEFLSTYFVQRAAFEARGLTSTETGIVDEFAAAVLTYQAPLNPAADDVFEGAIASSLSGTQRQYTAFGNAACGQALLAGYAATGNTAYRARAVEIGDFLLRLQDPRPYFVPYGSQPFLDNNGVPAEPPGGFVDQVTSERNLYNTMSTWNLRAVAFLRQLADELGAGGTPYATAAAAARRFMATGLDRPADWYTPNFSSANTAQHKIVSSPDCRDNDWHRFGTRTSSGSSTLCDVEGTTVGTDQVEYGLAALYDYELRVSGHAAATSAVQDKYFAWSSLPGYHTGSTQQPTYCTDDSLAGSVDPYYPPDNQGALPSGDVWDYDPHLSFGGYFRFGTPTNAEIKYYDIVGFGILAEVRAALVPTKFQHAYERLNAADRDDSFSAIVYRSLQRMALPTADEYDADGDGNTTERICKITRGTLPIAVNGLGILRTLGYAGSRA